MNKVAGIMTDDLQLSRARPVPALAKEPMITAQIQAPAETYLDMILKAARDPSVDITKMERLMALRERMIGAEAEKAFNEAMRDVQQALPRVFRNAKSESGKYATLEAIDIASRPIITVQGFAESYGTAESPLPNHYRITCVLSHVGGHSRPYHADVPTDMLGPKGAAVKTAIHGFGSAMSYGRRYLKCLIFNIVLTNEDDDGKSAGQGSLVKNELVSDDQVTQLRELLTETGANFSLFLKAVKVESLDEIKAVNFDRVCENVRRRAAERGVAK